MTATPATAHDTAPATATTSAPTYPVNLRINGQPYHLQLEAWVSLLDLLRDRLDLTGTRKVATMANAALARCWSMAAASTAA